MTTIENLILKTIDERKASDVKVVISTLGYRVIAKRYTPDFIKTIAKF